MKKQPFCFTLSAIIVCLTGFTLNSAVAASQPLGGNGTHFCGVIDYPPDKQYSNQFPNRNYARTSAANLNVGEPRTVRLIYFLPNDRPYRAEVVQRMKDEILSVQTFFAEQMGVHGYGEVPFRIETDPQDEPMVHRVDGGHPDTHYFDPGTVIDEIDEVFDLHANVYLIAIDNSSNLIGSVGGVGGRRGKNGGWALVPDEFSFRVAAHELGHAFGLNHDFRDVAYIMSYGRGARSKLSPCHAECLSVHPYFNDRQQSQNVFNTTVQMFPPSLASPPNAIRFRFEVTDSDGLHQVQLLTRDFAWDGGGYLAVIGCKRLTGTNSTVEFVTTELISRNSSVWLWLIDVHGNFSWSESFPIDITSLLPPPEVVSIPDANLAAAVRGTPTTHTMLNLTRLDASNSQVTDLTGLEHATNLRVLTLNNNSISDISLVAGLTKLEWLWLNNTSIVDISAVSGLTKLESLWLNNTSIVDISAVSGLTNLISLHLNNTSIVDISSVAGLTNLIELWLWGNSLTDISTLVGLTNLAWLNLGGNSVSDISALAGLTQLHTLNLNNNSISDISSVAGLTKLEWLFLQNNSLTDISALAGLTNLTRLSLGGNSLTDISTLAGLTNLTRLSLGGNSLTDISTLAGLTNLTRLSLGGNSLTDISTLAGLTNLTYLGLLGNSFTDISTLAGLTNLTRLSLGDNTVSDISALAGLTNLTSLWLWNNSVSDLSPLVANTGLGSGDEVSVQRNPLSYQSIHTHIPTLQSRGVTVEFDNRAYPALLKISGNNQQGAPFAPLSNPYVVEVQDENGSAFVGVSVTFAVTAGGGTLSVTDTITDENGRAQSTLTLGPNLGTNTVSVSAAGIKGSVTFHAISDDLPTEYLWSVPEGISLIHVPLKVTAVDGTEKTIEYVSDLYDALGGADRVNILATDLTTQGWRSYTSIQDRGTSVDTTLTDDTGIIAVMNHPVSLRLNGDALGSNGNSTITLHPGPNLVGVPLRDLRIGWVSDLFTLDGIRGNVSGITAADNGRLQTVRQAGDAGDSHVIGGQSFVLTAQAAARVVISGDGWYNRLVTAAAAPVAIRGIEVGDATPILALRGSIVSYVDGWGKMPHLQSGSGFRVTVKNLSTGRKVATVTAHDEVDYRLTVVDLETGRAAQIGDILEISVRSPSPLISVEPFQYVVTAEDVKHSRIDLTELVAYEIPTETELLRNYPNPFNPETWIPYWLAEDAFVTLTIYDGSGRVIRTLDVGHRIAAVYESRSKAIYWDGRNGLGEQVASGVYFYTLTAGDYSATRKMVILK